MDYNIFLTLLTLHPHDEVIRYLIEQSNNQKKNLSLNFIDKTFTVGGKRNMIMRYFLSKCYNLKEYERRNVEIKDNAKLRKMTHVNGVGYVENMHPNHVNIDLENWIRRINEWLLDSE